MGPPIIIDQAIFGYRDGHNILAASVELAPRVRQFLATATDGSGPEKSEGFKDGYTGLPVPDTDFYALFCTWPAPEMTRPGCVWSHVLLINLADLARIPDLGALRHLFARPKEPNELDSYRKRLDLLTPRRKRRLKNESDLDRAMVLASALYGQPEPGVVLLDASADDWKDLVFDLWSQQWPRLRRSFAFSTASLGDRRTLGVPFDLQIAPSSSQRLWRRDPSSTLIVSAEDSAAERPAAWMGTVARDLVEGSDGALRRFLHKYGSEVDSPRKAFSKLVECFLALDAEADHDPVERLACVAQAFPKPEESVTLKRDVAVSLTSRQSDCSIALASTYFLLKSPNASAFDRVEVDFRPNAPVFWDKKRAEVLALLGSLSDGSRAQGFIGAISEALHPADIPILWYEQPQSLSRVVANNPSLATDPAAWAMPEAGQHALWESITSSNRDPEVWSRICAAMLLTRCSFGQEKTIALAGSSLGKGLLAWLMHDAMSLPGPEWRAALREPLSAMLEQGGVPPALLALASWALHSRDATAIAGTRSDVQKLATGATNGLPMPLRLHALFWMTALGLQTSGKEGLNLLSAAFFPVYEAVARSNYSGEAWEMLSPALPESMLGLDWDRCRRMRRALQRWLHDNPSAGQELRDRSAPEFSSLISSLS